MVYRICPLVRESLSSKLRGEKDILDNYELVKNNYEIIVNSDILYSNTTWPNLYYLTNQK